MPGTIELRSERLLLRRMRLDDAPALHRLFGTDEAMWRYSGWNPFATVGMADQSVRGALAAYADPHFYAWIAEHEGMIVGNASAYDYQAEPKSAELGISIARSFWHQGFAGEALLRMVTYLMDEEGLASVAAWCAEDNIASRKALEHAGLTLRSTDAGGLEVDGHRYDKQNFLLTAAEWQARPIH